MAGCLVTEEIDFEEENVPPRLVNDPAGETPINQIIEIDTPEASVGVRFSLLIEDENIGQRYEVKWRESYTAVLEDGSVETRVDNWQATFGYIPPLPDRARLELPLNLDKGTCKFIEVRVSSGFEPSTAQEDPVPIIEGDVAFANWIAWVVDSETPVSSRRCPTHKVRPQP